MHVYNCEAGDIIHIKYLNALTEEMSESDGFVECNPEGSDTMEISHFLPCHTHQLQQIKAYCNIHQSVSCKQQTNLPMMKYDKLEKISSSKKIHELSSVPTLSGIVKYSYKASFKGLQINDIISSCMEFVHLVNCDISD